MTTIRRAFLMLSTTALLPALPATADGPTPPATQAAIPEASEPTLPTTAWEPLRFALAAEFQTGWMLQDDARRLWGKRSVGGVGLSFSYDAIRLGGRMTLGLDVSWLATKTSTTMDSTATGFNLPQKSSTQVFNLGLSLRYNVFRWLSPYARVAGGTGWAALTLGSAGFDLRDRAVIYQGSAGAGLLVRSAGVRVGRTRKWPTLAFVGCVEGGYTMGNATSFSLKSSVDGSNKDPIPVAPVSIGEVTRRFPYLRISIGVGF
jgi:hypothetical protein